MKSLKNIGIFLGGAVIGGIITGYVIKNKYEELMDEEIQSVKEVYKNRTGITEEFIERKEYRESDLIENCDIEKVASTDDIKEYNANKKNNSKHDYGKYSRKNKEDVEEVVEVEHEEMYIPPTIIDEEEVGMHGFDMKVLTYYQDGILTDDSDTVLDIDTYIGSDNIKLFDESHGCMTMFVRNEQTGIDYEIQRDDMTWSDFAIQMGIDHGYDNLHSS